MMIVWICMAAGVARAKDVIHIYRPHSLLDQRHVYHNTLLSEAMKKTRPGWGDFEISQVLPATQRRRALAHLISGNHINVHIVPTQKTWEEQAIPIRIPIAKGLLGFRLFLIKKGNAEPFARINSLADLKRYKAGLRQHWSTALAMERLGFPVIKGSDYEGLFHMLVSDRFDYFPRGVNEIFPEYNSRCRLIPELTVEQTMALYLPLPTYIFVSPAHPRLARRIRTGLEHMIEDGSFDRLFWHFHGDSIQKARLSQRRIFILKNPLLSAETPFHRKALWLDPVGIPAAR